LKGITIHREEGIDFLLLPKDCKAPVNFAFRTAQGTEGFLQIVELNEDKPKSMRLRWKVTKRANEAPAETAAADTTPRKILLPDADTKDTAVILDLASGEMLKLPWESADTSAAFQETDQDTRHFTKLGKGDLGFDSMLFCLRGGEVELFENGTAKPYKVNGRKDDAKIYQLPKNLPCELVVTTPENRRFLVKVLAETAKGGLDIEYRQLGEKELLSVSETSQPAAASSDPEGFEPVRTLLIHDDSTKAASMVDLDTGALYLRPSGEEAKGMSAEAWMASKGIDAGCETNAAAPGLWGIDMIVLPVSDDAWETMPAAEIESELRDGKPGSPAIMSALGGLPRTFCFATREGGKGILQIVGQTKDGRGEAFEVRYRLLSQDRKVAEAKADLAAGVLDFRIAANDEEAKAFERTGKDLGWYESATVDAGNLVTRQQGKRVEVLLWQTPEKSMTAGESGGNAWRIIEVSVIAEPDKPGRIGVVFDEEGGRRLQELTAGNIDRRLAVLVDGRVVACPIVRSPISQRVEITGDFSKEELARLADALQAGMKPERPSEP